MVARIVVCMAYSPISNRIKSKKPISGRWVILSKKIESRVNGIQHPRRETGRKSDQFPHVGEMPGDRRRRRHRGADEMGAPTATLATLKIAI